jgi:hypothetical protein
MRANTDTMQYSLSSRYQVPFTMTAKPRKNVLVHQVKTNQPTNPKLNITIHSILNHLRNARSMNRYPRRLEPIRVIHARFVRKRKVSARCVKIVFFFSNLTKRGGKNSRVVPHTKVAHPHCGGCPVVVVCESTGVKDFDDGGQTRGRHEHEVS